MNDRNWRVGMRLLKPGVYVDRCGAMHLDLDELFEGHGYEATEENRMVLRQATREMALAMRAVLHGRAWRREIRPRILERAGRRCERCSKPDRALVFTYSWKQGGEAHMIWIRRGSKVWRNQRGWPVSPLHAAGLPRRIRVILTVAHLNHDPADNRDENLAALCQWCHLHHDAGKHRETRQARKDAGRPLLAEMQQAKNTPAAAPLV